MEAKAKEAWGLKALPPALGPKGRDFALIPLALKRLSEIHRKSPYSLPFPLPKEALWEEITRGEGDLWERILRAVEVLRREVPSLPLIEETPSEGERERLTRWVEALETLPLSLEDYLHGLGPCSLSPSAAALMVGLARPAPEARILDLTGGEVLGPIRHQVGTGPRLHVLARGPGAALLAWTHLVLLGLEGEVGVGSLPKGPFNHLFSCPMEPFAKEEILSLLTPQGVAALLLGPKGLHGAWARGLAEGGHVEAAIRLSSRLFGLEGIILLLRAQGGRTKVFMMDTEGLGDLLGNEALVRFILRLYGQRRPIEGFSLLVRAEGVMGRGLDPRRYVGRPSGRRSR